LRIVPRLLRTTATKIMESAYHQAASEVPAGFDPADQLILLPDWSGKVFNDYGIEEVNRFMRLLFIDPDGLVRDTYQGPDVIQKAYAMIRPYLQAD
jgi:hypothetical protein